MKHSQYLWILLLLFTFSSGVAQVPVSSGFNYYDINKDAFLPIKQGFKNYFGAYPLDERKYWSTSIELGLAAQSLFKNSSAAPALDIVKGSYQIKRRIYADQTLGGESMKMILLRPNDNVYRPVVLVTHGGDLAGGNALLMMRLGVTDLVQRGFAVLYYKSGTEKGGSIFTDALSEAGIGAPCNDPKINPYTKECLEQRLYTKMQLGYAAAQYAAEYRDSFHLETNEMFLAGFSGGAAGSLIIALADETTNFQAPLFSSQGDFNRFSKAPTRAFSIKGVATLGGSLIENSSIGSLIGPEDAGTRFIMFHGQDDAALKPDKGPIFWGRTLNAPSTTDAFVEGSLDLVPQMQASGITSKAILNCSGCHEVFSYPCEYCDDCDGNYNFTQAFDCYEWREQNFNGMLQLPGFFGQNPRKLAYFLMQIHDIGMLTAHFFHPDIADTPVPVTGSAFANDILSDLAPAAINPTDYPYVNGNRNGHFQRSTKCLAQTNAGLFFNQKNDVDIFSVLSRGDFLVIPWSVLGQTDVFGGDFTFEFRFKTKNQPGRGTLLSYLDGSNRGMELFINYDGKLIFQYRNTFQLVANGNYKDNACHHVAVSRSGNNFRIWIDGVMIAEKLNAGSGNYNLPDFLVLGNTRQISNNKGFNGIMSEFRLWSKAIISSAELNIPNLPANAPGLVAHWIFDDGAAQILESNANGNTAYAVLGFDPNDFSFDPKWIENDEFSACVSPAFPPAKAGIATSDAVQEFAAMQLDILAYPNPSSGQVWVQFPDDFQGQTAFSVLNMQGQSLYAYDANIQAGGAPIQLNLGEVPAGIYFLTIRSGERFATQKIEVK